MNRLEELRERIDRREACVGVVGLGYVGLPLALEFAKAGCPVVGFDLEWSNGTGPIGETFHLFDRLNITPLPMVVGGVEVRVEVLGDGMKVT